VTDTTDRETNERTNKRTDGRASSSIHPFVETPSKRRTDGWTPPSISYMEFDTTLGQETRQNYSITGKPTQAMFQ